MKTSDQLLIMAYINQIREECKSDNTDLHKIEQLANKIENIMMDEDE